MEEENPVEKAHEDLHEKAEHSREPWIGRVALTAALLAGIAAIASSLSGHHESEGILEQIKASDQWSYYQAKGIKADIFKVLKPESPEIRRYTEEQKEIRAEATKAQEASRAHMQVHQIFAKAVTFSQIAIAIAARKTPTAQMPTSASATPAIVAPSMPEKTSAKSGSATTSASARNAIAAITVLTRRPGFWAVSLIFGGIALAYLAQGLWLTYHLRELMG